MALFNKNKQSKEEKEILKTINKYFNYKIGKDKVKITLKGGKLVHHRPKSNPINNVKNEYPLICKETYDYCLNNNIINKESVESVLFDKVDEIMGVQYTEEERKEIKNELKEERKQDKEQRKVDNISDKFGVDLSDCIECTMEEQRRGTFSNNRQRDVVNAYIKVDNDKLEIFKESVWIKSDMGSETIYYDNIANIDVDNRGLLNASGQLVISLKTNKEIVLKLFKDNNDKDKIVDSYNNYMNNSIGGDNNSDKLLIFAQLYDKGLLTLEEFENLKKEII